MLDQEMEMVLQQRKAAEELAKVCVDLRFLECVDALTVLYILLYVLYRYVRDCSRMSAGFMVHYLE